MSEPNNKMKVALELVWRLAVRKEVHLGYERASGIADGCIPCICAAALELGWDEVSIEELQEQIDKLTTSK